MFCSGTESTTVQSPCKSTLVMILQMLFNTKMLYLPFAISYFLKNCSREIIWLLSMYVRVLTTVKNSAVNAVFPISSIIELPNLCFPNME